MAEQQIQRNLFTSLKRLFSTDVIIRNDGGTLKTVDVERIQVDGVLQTNALIDRFNRVYTTSTSYGVNLNLAQNYQSTRVQIYADYEAMDTDPIIASALDIIADECLGADTIIPLLDGRRVTIKELYDSKETNFWLYGLDDDNTFKPIQADKVAYNGEKEVYKITLDDGTEIEATSNHIWIDYKGDQIFTDQLISGSSILTLRELHSIYYISYPSKVISVESVGKKPVYDIVNAGDNHIFAIETKDGSKLYTHNCTLKNAQGDVLQIVTADKNIQTILRSLFYDVLNIEFNLWFWIRNMCIQEDTMIPLLDGTEIKIKDLAERKKNNPEEDIWVYSVQEGTNKLVPGKVTWCDITRENTDIVRITLDDNTYVDTTPDHKFIMRDGTKKQAIDLKEGDSLMPYSTEMCKVVSVTILPHKANTYCMEVEGPNNEQDRHNFAICSNNEDGTYSRNGVFVSNCKYGDFFLKLEIAEKYGIYNVIPFSAYNIVRLEGTNPDNPSEVIYKYDPTAALGATAGYSTSYQNTDLGITFYNYEMAHLRLIGDINFLPYGRSYIEASRKLYKQYVLMEDAMLIHRITRAPERRVFYVNVGAIPPGEVENYMQRMISKMKKIPLVDSTTGQYNLNYNVQNMLEDFFIPVRGNDTSTKIDTAKGLEYNGIEDINYLLNKLFASLKIPKAFLGYEKDLSGKCIAPDTKIKLLDGTIRTIKEIAEYYETDYSEPLWTYSYDFVENRVIPGKIVLAEKTRLNAQVVRVHIDNDTYIDSTPDHGFILKDGTKVEAKDLKEGDSLRTIITRNSPIKGVKSSEYQQVYQPKDKNWEFTHKMVDSYFNGVIENNGRLPDGSFSKKDLIVIHHKDFNRFNNSPQNLDRMGWENHINLHKDLSQYTIHSEESKRKSKETKQTEEYKLSASQRRKKQLENNPELKSILKNSWANKTYEERSNIVKKGYLNPERSEITSILNKKRNSHIPLLDGYKKSFPDGRYDMLGTKNINWRDRPNFSNIVETLKNNKNKILKFKDLCDILNYTPYIIREIIQENGYTVNQLLNENLGFIKGRPKDLSFDFIKNKANGSKDINSFYNEIGLTKKQLKNILNKENITLEYFLNEEIGICFNHKVVRVEWLENKTDTYNMEVYDKNENHNYLTDTQVVIKNSTLAQEDVRFARTIERLQRIVLGELTKIALVHLYAIGYTDESLTNFELDLTIPSIVYEQERVALMKEKMDLAAQMIDTNLLPTDWIYDKLFHFSEEEFDEYRGLIVEDKKRTFRLKQIEEEGNDPAETGEAYGTPHQIASMYGGYGNTNLAAADTPQGYNEIDPNEPVRLPGRPQDKVSVINTQDDPLGQDRMGAYDMKSKPNDSKPDNSLKTKYKGGSPLALKENPVPSVTQTTYLKNKKSLESLHKKISLYKEPELLNENNIKRDLSE